MLEASYPVRIDAFELRTDSGGAGQYRGGLGLTKRYTVLENLTVSTGFERSQCAPGGVRGGLDGDEGCPGGRVDACSCEADGCKGLEAPAEAAEMSGKHVPS